MSDFKDIQPGMAPFHLDGPWGGEPTDWVASVGFEQSVRSDGSLVVSVQDDIAVEVSPDNWEQPRRMLVIRNNEQRDFVHRYIQMCCSEEFSWEATGMVIDLLFLVLKDGR